MAGIADTIIVLRSTGIITRLWNSHWLWRFSTVWLLALSEILKYKPAVLDFSAPIWGLPDVEGLEYGPFESLSLDSYLLPIDTYGISLILTICVIEWAYFRLHPSTDLPAHLGYDDKYCRNYWFVERLRMVLNSTIWKRNHAKWNWQKSIEVLQTVSNLIITIVRLSARSIIRRSHGHGKYKGQQTLKLQSTLLDDHVHLEQNRRLLHCNW